jgi:hypothetical protein
MRMGLPLDPEIPNSRSPDSRFCRETGKESPIPGSAASAVIGKQGMPDSRFGRERESGSRLASRIEIGKSGISLDTPLCECIMHDPGLARDVALGP